MKINYAKLWNCPGIHYLAWDSLMEGKKKQDAMGSIGFVFHA